VSDGVYESTLAALGECRALVASLQAELRNMPYGETEVLKAQLVECRAENDRLRRKGKCSGCKIREYILREHETHAKLTACMNELRERNEDLEYWRPIVETWKQRADALEKAGVKVSSFADDLWEPMGGTPVYPELADLCQAIMDMREVLVDQSEAERD
jgi:hypothetical protein